MLQFRALRDFFFSLCSPKGKNPLKGEAEQDMSMPNGNINIFIFKILHYNSWEEAGNHLALQIHPPSALPPFQVIRTPPIC